MIVFREPDRHIDIRTLCSVFIAVECLRIDVQFLGSLTPRNSGRFAGFQQIVRHIFHAASPTHKILTDILRSLPGGSADLPEDVEGIAVKMHRDRLVLRIHGNKERPVAVILKLLDIGIVIQ